MFIDRETIIQVIKEAFENNPYVHAYWLEGSDGTKSIDSYSDLDIVLDVEDGHENIILKEIEKILSELSPLDLCYEPEFSHPKLKYKVFHLQDTPESLFLDVSVQSHSRDAQFCIQKTSEVPKVIFDKSNVIRFCDLNKTKLQAEIQDRIYHLENIFKQQARARKYAKRQLFLEALAYYHKYVLHPLVELLRIQYAPINYDYFLVHISRDLPQDVVTELEVLYQVNSTEAIMENIEKANVLFRQTLSKVKKHINL